MTKIIRLTISLTLVAGLAAACGGNGDDTTTGATDGVTSATPSETAAGGEEVTLVMMDNVFQPMDLTVASGSTLVLANEGAAPHNFSIDGQNIDQDVSPRGSGSESIELAPGTYDFFCKFHVPGMAGTLTVE